jgi:hypothetical protein
LRRAYSVLRTPRGGRRTVPMRKPSSGSRAVPSLTTRIAIDYFIPALARKTPNNPSEARRK